ncbi:MAG: hypothetical protein K8H88_06065, partial [Sandaracinaceae bacterium]|nr:hypothetical protein [Sandaracinaceae bacterium]
GLYVGDTELGDTQVVVLDSKGVFGINLHAAGQSSDDVNNWSEGCQVQKVKANFEQFRALVELSKHARCANRKAGHKDPCASIAHPSLLMEDVVLMHFGNKDEQTAYNAVRRTAPAADLTAKADAVLAARWADGSLDDEFVDALQGKVDGVSFHESPQTGPVADPAPNLTNTLKSGYKAAIQAVVNAHLLPGADNDKLRKKIGVSALQKKLESYTSADIQRDPAVKSAIDTAVAGLAKNVKKKTVLGYKTVTDAVRAAEERSRTACLGKLGTELDRVTTDVADRQKTTIDDIKAKRKDTAANWTAEGFQLCDYLWQCSFKLSYTLAEVDKPLVDEVDARPK